MPSTNFLLFRLLFASTLLIATYLFPICVSAQQDQKQLSQDLSSEDPRTRYAAVFSMVSQGPLLKDGIDLLLARATDEEPVIRVLVANGLGKLTDQDDKVTPVLLALLKDDEKAVRIEAIQSLGRLSMIDSVAFHDITSVMKVGSKQEKISALSAISNYGPAAQVVSGEIAPMLNDQDWLVRSFALDTLLEIGGSDAEAAIATSVKTANTEMLVGTAESLGAYQRRFAQFTVLFEYLWRNIFVVLAFLFSFGVVLRWMVKKGILTLY